MSHVTAAAQERTAFRLGDRPVLAGLLALLLWLPIPFGSNRLWAEALFELAVAALLLLWLLQWLRGRADAGRRLWGAWLPLGLWLLWLGWTGGQWLERPLAELAARSPAAHAHYQAAYALAGQPLPAELPLSVTAEATRQHWYLSLAYFGLYLLVLLTASSRRRLKWLAWTLILSGLLQAAYGGFMVLSGLEYGFLQKKEWYQGFATGTFVNRNHLAGYLQITLAVGIGLVLSKLGSGGGSNWRTRLRALILLLSSSKMRLRVFLALMVLGLILTRSRMGNAAFFISLTGCGLLYVLLRERRLFWRALLLFASLLLVDIWILGSSVGLDELLERFASTQIEAEPRIALYSDLRPMIETYARSGSGLGSFFAVYPGFRSAEVAFFNDHAHNDYAQFLIEAGYLGAGLLGLLALYTLLRSLLIIAVRRDRLACGIAFGGLMALVSLALHSLTDFNLQIPANAATLVAVMAMVAACSTESSRRRKWRPVPAAETAESGSAEPPVRLLRRLDELEGAASEQKA